MTLPAYEIEPALRLALQEKRARVLLKAPTGSGKSTAVPGMLVDAGIPGKILVIEPRRMAARLLAGWVAKLRKATLGHEVGYAIRYDTKYREDSRIIYLTDGVFQRWIQDDPELKGVGAVIFDEFHERRLTVDIALARCLDLQESARPDLRVVVMSATLETAGLADYLAPAVSLEAGGRMFPVQVFYRADRPPQNDRRGGPPQVTPVWEKMANVCREAMAMPEPGNILMFLPGTHEIRRTVELLENSGIAKGWDVFPLYSSLPPAAQEEAISPGPRPKIIVATNVAETSLTIDGVRTVIDSGLARTASFEPRRGINTLLITKISRAAAEQRAGRAGRTASGRAFRLWSEAEHGRRAEFESPEVHRVDLAEAVLLLKAAGVPEVRDFRWFDAPVELSLSRAERLLHDLGALDSDRNLTDEGRKMASLPLEPRFSRLMLAGHEHGCVAETAFIAATVQGDGIFTTKRGGPGRKDFIFPDDDTDFAGEWRAFESAGAMGFDPRRCDQVGVMARGAREISQGFDRLGSMARRFGWEWRGVDFHSNHEAVGKAMLAAFSDQLAIRLSQGTLACKLVGNRKGKLDEDSCVRKAPAFVAAEITEVEAREIITHLRRATATDPAWLAELFPDDLTVSDGASWDDVRRRVVARKETKFRDLVLEAKESDHGVNLDAAAELLAARVLTGELILKNWDDSVNQWTARLASLGRWMPELELPGWSDEDRADAIAQICHGAVSYKEIKEANVWRVLREWLSHTQRAALDSYAPERVNLPNGQTAKVTYTDGMDPFISVRVSHLFGMWETPTVAGGRVPLLVHILTPGQKPWQMTKDLKGFWAGGYAQMKKEVAGRYPRHPWPDDPKGWVAAGSPRK
ncbi:DEAD/DEAH box helicase [Luteolibacter yonseiensis]|uniref:DEAD/DEAH box helicase n=1 Tax=Luteolibacter yonseiensis TaxID=1144680 RepID=A0A934R4S9_9BACT|nr:ATP-dependent helicase C-terminal domain-containing protein [Luteolibacter yonseiensis]MBK1818418.1 DEAD/DEAH box helicase [Luteolibacter yonseiensis]